MRPFTVFERHKMLLLVFTLFWPAVLFAESSIHASENESGNPCKKVPLIRARVAMPEEEHRDVYRIDEAVYRLSISGEEARGEMLVSGEVLSGRPKRIPIIGEDIVVSDIQEVSGGSLLCDLEEGPGILLFPDKSRAFRVKLTFLLPVREDNQSKFVSFHIPSALKNSLSLECERDIRLEPYPEVSDERGVYHFSGERELLVRFSEGP